MDNQDNNWIRRKIEETLLESVRASLNEEKAGEKANSVRNKFPGMPNDALAKILTDRAVKKTMIEGAANGGGITAAEAVLAAPAPEAGQRALAIASIGTLLATDVAFTTKVQMQLLLEIGYIYECPFNKDDEDDVWLIFKAALGTKGTERVGAYGRFIFSEAAKKQFRSLLRGGGRRAIQETVRRIAGKEVAKYLSEKALMRLIPVLNAAIGAWFNRWVTRRVGRWARVKAKIRASAFRGIDQVSLADRELAVMTLPIIFLAGTAHGEVTDNIISLYAQASNRLGLKEEEIEVIERMLDRKDFELHVIEQLRQIQSVTAKPQILNVAVIAAAASCLTVCDGQHACLQRISNALGVPYGQADLIAIIEYLKR